MQVTLGITNQVEDRRGNTVQFDLTYETAPAGPVRHLSDRSIRSMDRSEIFDISGTGPRSLISKQMN